MAAIQLLSIPEIMAMAKGSVDIANRNGEVDWWGIFSAKVSAGHFDAIVDEIQANGFGMPIVLCDMYGDGHYSIGNGHHRLSAAILLGLWRIPVIVADGADRGDYMQPNDSMDDYGRPINYAGTYDYWNMLQQNMEESDYNNYDESDHPQFYCDYCGEYLNNSVYCCEECHNNDQHPRCSICEEVECGDDHECAECGAIAVNAEDHLIACHERDYGMMYHWDAEFPNHYVFSACIRCDGERWDDALSEHAEFLALSVPIGMWHPAAVLADAYADDEAWEADRPLREARAYWEGRLDVLKASVLAGFYSDDYLSVCAVDVAEARAAYMAL